MCVIRNETLLLEWPRNYFSDKWSSFSPALPFHCSEAAHCKTLFKLVLLKVVSREIQVVFSYLEVFYHTEPLECNVCLCPISVM